uniref:Ubiquitinspecific protease putative n=1 Tax=Albugo laibachii Nc14 TaxID=890382 RepID=F0WIM9_9STRA|nr:ubiquitinspecific protease putative [Albugo laibachii Nc14]|eukprot:CCA21120.1 ubiquitinspecific protease putative [Albugo laibachii Nc14]
MSASTHTTALDKNPQLLILFGDFTLEETEKHLGNERKHSKVGVASEDAQTEPQTQKSYADALKKSKAKAASDTTGTPWKGPLEIKSSIRNELSFEEALQEALASLNITAPGVEVKKRGLVNQGNTCFQNVIMQSLMACSPFLNLFISISRQVASNKELLSSSNTFRAWKYMVAFTREFEEPSLMQLRAISSYLDNDERTSKAIRIRGYFMEVLSALQKSRGDEEDALEFLEFFLDYLHSEYVTSGLRLPAVCTRNVGMQAKENEVSTIESDDGWAEIGKKGKTSTIRQTSFDSSVSPINWLFRGSLRSELQQAGKKQNSINIEAFHCLHLNLDHQEGAQMAIPGNQHGVGPGASKKESVKLEEMILETFSEEFLDDDSNPGGMKRLTRMESLPIVLTLNIKRFTYDPKLGPVKLQQFVKYPAKFEFPLHLMSKACRAEHVASIRGAIDQSTSDYGSIAPPVYELCAVVTHHGKYVAGGHYTCVCRDNKDQWFHYDDERVSLVTEACALQENAYLLFYIRSTPDNSKTLPASSKEEPWAFSSAQNFKRGNTSRPMHQTSPNEQNAV